MHRNRHNNPVSFSGIFSSHVLSDALDQLELSFSVTDEQELFGNLVNTSTSGDQPYHRWGRYREAYGGDLCRELIRRSSINPRSQFIFDPMCGSGSTLVASAQLGFDCLGCDINPYAVDLTNAKVRHYSFHDLRKVESFIRKPIEAARQLTLATRRQGEECKSYFKPDLLAQLHAVRDAIETVHGKTAQDLLAVAWLTILEDCSEKWKDGNGLASRPSSIREVWPCFTQKVEMILEDLRNAPLPISVTGVAWEESAFESSTLVERFRNQVGKELGAVIFSPPYANSFDYFESYKLELLCHYYDGNELRRARGKAIRNYRKGYHHDLTASNVLVQMLCDEIRARIPEKEAQSGKRDSRTRLVPNLIVGYFEDMERVIEELSHCMVSGSVCYIVVDQSSYLGIIVPTDTLLASIAQSHQFRAQGLIRCRGTKTSGQQLSRYPYLKTMLRGSIVCLQKL
jgi:site-specific DNA-methyltransferase (adenine-specific)